MKAVTIRNLAVILLIFGLAAVALGGMEKPGPRALPASGQPIEESANLPKPDTEAPAFTLQGLDGTSYSVGGARENPVLVNFWASWCGPCKEEAPDLNQLAAKYDGRLDIYGVNVTRYDNRQNAERFIRKYKVSYPIMFDTDGKVYESYGGAVFPTNVLIDRDGRVQEVILGALSFEELDDKVGKLVDDE